MLEFHRVYWQGFYTFGSEYASVLDLFSKQLQDNFKLKYPRETLKKLDMYGLYMTYKTWIFFLALSNIHFIVIWERIWEILCHPWFSLAHHPGISSNIINAADFSMPLVPVTLAHHPLYPRWHATHATHADTSP